jgi:hypothetical protein
MGKSILRDRSFDVAMQIVKLLPFPQGEKNAFLMSKQYCDVELLSVHLSMHQNLLKA